MNEELQYGYPADIDDLDLDTIKYHYNSNQRFKKRIVIITVFVLLMILIYCVTLNGLAGAAVLLGIGCVIVTVSFYRKINSHALVIEAYESYIDLQYHSSEYSYYTNAHLLYSDIMALNFSDKYDRVTISYVNRSGKSYVRQFGADGKELKHNLKQDNFFSANLNAYTPEQGFFLYYAHKLFGTEQSTKERKKILKKFGDAELYFGSDGLTDDDE